MTHDSSSLMGSWSTNAALLVLGLTLGTYFNTTSTPASTVNKAPQRANVPSGSPPKQVEFSPLQKAVHSFAAYRVVSHESNARRRSNYQQLSLAHTLTAEKLGYTQRLVDVQRAIDATADFAERVAEYVRETHPDTLLKFDVKDLKFPMDVGQVQTELQHMVRDWSDDGREERAKLLEPILGALAKEFPDGGVGKNVLVPGAGLGRLAHEISRQQGFNVDMAELSQFAIQTYRYLVNNTDSTYQHTIYPWATTFQHQRAAKYAVAPVRFPDVLPDAQNVRLIEGDFTKSLTGREFVEKYDAVVTLYFIDTARNFLEYAETIRRVLKPGGIWINLGPLKWGGYSQLQLTAEQVLQAVELNGFDVDQSSKKEELNVYGHQQEALLRFTYVTQFWAARKRAASGNAEL